MLWDLFQQSEIQGQADRTDLLLKRVAALENEVQQLRALLREVIIRLEKNTGADLDKDGRIG